MVALRKILSGRRARRSVEARELAQSGLLDVAWYLSRYRGKGGSPRDPIAHYLVVGAAKGHWPNALFDPQWYATTYAGAVGEGTPPVLSYLRDGLAAGHRPNPFFDTRWYVERYPEALESGQHPLIHYLRHGVAEGLDPSPEFGTLWYLESYPDVRAAGQHPLVHFLHHGRAEGRLPLPTSPDDWAEARVFGSRRRSGAAAGVETGIAGPAACPDPVLGALAEAVAAVRRRDPAARFLDATYPDHVLPSLVPGATVTAPAALLARPDRSRFYAGFRQEGGHRPILIGGLPRRADAQEWAYVGACDGLPPDLAAALAERSLLVRDEPGRLADALAGMPLEAVERIALGPVDAAGRQVVALVAPERAGALARRPAEAGAPKPPPARDRFTLQPRHLVCARGIAESEGPHSWIWCGPDQTLHLALGRRPSARTTLKVTFNAIDADIAAGSATLLRFRLNGRPTEACFAVEGRSGVALVTVPQIPPGDAAEPLVLSVGCREGLRPPGEDRLLTMHIRAITLMLSEPRPATRETTAR